MTDASSKPVITGRCYCGKTRFKASEPPITVTYCHCADCRRVTGAPVAAFAAFPNSAVTYAPNEGREVSINPGVRRIFYEDCGSPISGQYDYLPDTVYISIGLIDQADAFPPELHSHHDSKLSWLHIDDALERQEGSARAQLDKQPR